MVHFFYYSCSKLPQLAPQLTGQMFSAITIALYTRITRPSNFSEPYIVPKFGTLASK